MSTPSAGNAFSGEGFDELLTKARAALESMRGGAAPAADGQAVEGIGTSADEKIRVITTTPGRVTSIELDPSVMRKPSEDLAADLAATVNAALDDLRSKATDALTAAPDLDALNGQLADLQENSVRQMAYFTSAANDAIAQIRSKGGTT